MDDMRLALLLNAVSPDVGGVLIRGEKGTAKSTAVRALAAILPEIDVIADCRFACDPAAPDPECPDGPHPLGGPSLTRPARLVELPVGATEDRLLGSLDLERALTEGVKAFEPGLLAAVNRGVLYVDEVNLLQDHMVDLLLDAAALGTAYVEREGVSVRHAARFLLVGTMNPEEGELRPQLLDRFGLTVEATAPRDPDIRAEVVRRRFAFETDARRFAATWARNGDSLRARIAEARHHLSRVVLPDAALRQITVVCAAFDVDGLRADLVTARTAMAHAAWCGREEVGERDIRIAARLALPHRRRRDPFDAPGLDEELLDQVLADARPKAPSRPPDDDDPGGGGMPVEHDPVAGAADVEVRQAAGDPLVSGEGTTARRSGRVADGLESEPAEEADREVVKPADPSRVRRLTVPGVGAGVPGRRSRSRTDHGRVVGSERPDGPMGKLHLLDTVMAAAPWQFSRGRTGPGLVLRRADLRRATLEGREGNLLLFLVDASGSMGSRTRMAAVKGAVLTLLRDAYQRRDKVGLITFRRTEAVLALPPTWSVEAAAARLATLPTGGRTPLAAGLLRALEVVRVERIRDPRRRPLLVVITDGMATGSLGTDPIARAHASAEHLAAQGITSVVIDCEAGLVRFGLAAELGKHLHAETIKLETFDTEPLIDAVRSARSRSRGPARAA
ncbi:magnesium chelatase subunit D family protein [Actinoplanes sp. CA-131856]